MIYFPRPEFSDPDSLHAEVAALGFGPCVIEWGETELGFGFDRELTGEEESDLSFVVSRHDGSAAIAAREDEARRVAAIKAQNEALLASARAKRLAGVALSNAELSALADSVLFPA
jgi:hypothetical protein